MSRLHGIALLVTANNIEAEIAEQERHVALRQADLDFALRNLQYGLDDAATARQLFADAEETVNCALGRKEPQRVQDPLNATRNRARTAKISAEKAIAPLRERVKVAEAELAAAKTCYRKLWEEAGRRQANERLNGAAAK